jgi:hypothetical protein
LVGVNEAFSALPRDPTFVGVKLFLQLVPLLFQLFMTGCRFRQHTLQFIVLLLQFEYQTVALGRIILIGWSRLPAGTQPDQQ